MTSISSNCNRRPSQTFTLNYGGVYDFGSVSIANGAPSLTPVQAYGFGTPTIFFQGIGTSNNPFNNELLGVFAQDSWKINSRLTLNYGVRYDIGWQPTFAAATPANAVAEKAFGVQEGVPVDSNNVSPRIGIAWDPWGNGKTVIRAGYGFFYDNPALALTFLATAEDGAAFGAAAVSRRHAGWFVKRRFDFSRNTECAEHGLFDGYSKHVLRAESATVQRVPTQFPLHQSKLSFGSQSRSAGRVRLSAGRHPLHDSDHQEFPIRAGAASEPFDRTRDKSRTGKSAWVTTTRTARTSTGRSTST